MVLDAVLADRRYTWLGTEQNKVAYFRSTCEQRGFGVDPSLPHLVCGAGAEKVIRYFPDRIPIGVERDYGPRHVFLYLVTSEVPAAFRMFLFRHADLLSTVQPWTIRLLAPRRFRKAIALYRRSDPACSRFRSRYSQEKVRCGALPRPLSNVAGRPVHGAVGRSVALLRDQLERGEGRIAFMALPHQYSRLTSLVGVA